MIRIRPYRVDDAPLLTRLYVSSVEELGARDYSPEQVRAWASLAPDPARMHALALHGRDRFVAVDRDGMPIGFVDIEPDGHIDYLYCAPEAKGSGAASALCDAVERLAAGRGVRRLHSEASEAAKRLFVRRGFSVLRRRELAVGGVPIHNYAVEERLTPDGGAFVSTRQDDR